MAARCSCRLAIKGALYNLVIGAAQMKLVVTADFDGHLKDQGYLAMGGQIIRLDPQTAQQPQGERGDNNRPSRRQKCRGAVRSPNLTRRMSPGEVGSAPGGFHDNLMLRDGALRLLSYRPRPEGVTRRAASRRTNVPKGLTNHPLSLGQHRREAAGKGGGIGQRLTFDDARLIQQQMGGVL